MPQHGANVFIRIRPPIRENGRAVVWKSQENVVFDRGSYIEEYAFPHVFTEDNADVFRTLNDYSAQGQDKTVIDSVYSGANETIFAYGQTGSGKTHTIFGEDTPNETDMPQTQRAEMGLLHMFAEDLFARAEELQDNAEVEIQVRCFEICGESLSDLLEDGLGPQTEVFLKTYRFKYQTVYVESVESCLNLLHYAQHARATGTSSCNDRSSRSHCVVQFNVLVTKCSDSLHCSSGTLTFVDLAGSERALDTKIATVSTRQLNASLASLIRLFRQLHEGELRESDRRQSVLNKLIFDYVQPSCGIWLIFCVSREQEHREYTSSTLQLATDSSKIRLCPQKYTFVKLDTTAPTNNACSRPVKRFDRVDNVKGTSVTSIENIAHNINDQLEQCSAMLDERFDKTNTRFQDYKNLLESSRNTTSSHFNALREIIQRRSLLRDATRRDASPLRTLARAHPRAFEKSGGVDCNDGREGRDRDEVIRDLRRQLAAKQAEHSEAACMLTNAQNALESMFTENVGLTEEFLEVLNSATNFLNNVQNENTELRQQLCDLDEKKKVALTELAEKNVELSEQWAVEDVRAMPEYRPKSTPLSGDSQSSSSSTPPRSACSPECAHESAAPRRNNTGPIRDCSPGRLRNIMTHGARSMNQREQARSRSACSTSALQGRAHSLLASRPGKEARRSIDDNINNRERYAFHDNGDQFPAAQTCHARNGDPYVWQKLNIDCDPHEPDGQPSTESRERGTKRFYDYHSLRAQVEECDISRLSRAIARSASLGRIRTRTLATRTK